ncbi:MAG: 16S rRNA (cytosine(1402)-N(4))-methyltransferase RsmH, partial [Duncaniella sp.]|nr:16S rRNA (cytosine(1402)-N(4))-methyltransferase RsmH [Duncaniella sp.]
MSDQPYHIPALLPQCLEALDVQPGGVYVDATFGGGGHSRAILEQLSPAGHLYSFDQDLDAVANAPQGDRRFTMVYSNFRFITNFMRYYDVEGVDGVLADLGVSFHHFDTPERGFSFRADGPLDMRMNRSASRPASRLLAEASRESLADIFKVYGELPQARRIADAIVKARESDRLPSTVGELIALVSPLIDPRKEKKELAQLFQALRIEVNDEMGALRQLLEGALRVLRPGGRLAVITYHSLEDRMVKNFMKTGNVTGHVDKDFYGRVNSPLKPLTNRPV